MFEIKNCLYCWDYFTLFCSAGFKIVLKNLNTF